MDIFYINNLPLEILFWELFEFSSTIDTSFNCVGVSNSVSISSTGSGVLLTGFFRSTFSRGDFSSKVTFDNLLPIGAGGFWELSEVERF